MVMHSMLLLLVVWLACGALIVLALDVVSALPPRGNWAAFTLWTMVGCGALALGLQWHKLPPTLAGLLLAVAVLLWRRRTRMLWAARHGGRW